MLYWICWTGFWVFTHLVCRLHVHGREHVPKTGALLVVPNHLSWYDPFLLGLAIPRRVWFFTKSEIFRWPLVGKICQWTGQISVARGESDRSALEKALVCLHEGKVLVIFPEGTVERQEKMIPAQTGAAMVALRTGVPILPIAHVGSRKVLRTWRSWFPRVDIYIGEPYVPSLPAGMSRKAGLREVTQDMMLRVAAMLPSECRGVYADDVLNPQGELMDKG